MSQREMTVDSTRPWDRNPMRDRRYVSREAEEDKNGL